MACEHKELVDLTQGLGEGRHYYCRKCGYHKYRGISFSKKGWEFYVNDFSKDVKKYANVKEYAEEIKKSIKNARKKCIKEEKII